MNNETNQGAPPGGQRPGAGRPRGTLSTQSSTLVARLRAETGLAQADLALKIGVREKTIYNYEKQSLIPKAGKVRAAIEGLAAEAKVPIDEPVAEESQL